MFRKYFFKKNKTKYGYTLIETMIAISIFLVVVVIGIAALLNAGILNNKSQSTRSIMDSLNYSIEDISKNIRTGYNYKCLEKGSSYTQPDLSIPSDCINGFGIAFESSEGNISDNTDQWVYYIKDGKLFRSTNGLNDSVQMTPDEVVLDENVYNFSVIGAVSTDVQHPFVIIRLVGKIMSRNDSIPFSLQTAVSQRKSDN